MVTLYLDVLQVPLNYLSEGTFKNYSCSSHAQLHVTQVKKVTFSKNKTGNSFNITKKTAALGI